MDTAVCSHPEHSTHTGGTAKMHHERCRDCGSRAKNTDGDNFEPGATGQESDGPPLSGKGDRRDRGTILSKRTWWHEHESDTTTERTIAAKR